MGRAVRGSAVASASALAAIVLIGCGGSSHTSPAQTIIVQTGAGTGTLVLMPMTHKEFVATLDGICKRGNAHVAELEREADKAINAGDYAKLAGVLGERQRLAAPYKAEVAKLTAPPADAAAFTRYKAMSKRLDGLLDRLIAALKAKDLTEARRLIALGDQARNKRTNAALDLGTQHCGS